MKIRYKSVTSKTPIVVELPDDIENADEIKKSILIFRVKNIVEARRNKKAIKMAEEGEILTVTGGDFPSLLEGKEKIDALYQAISKLLPRQQELVDKIYFRGMTITEIAKEEGVSYQAIQNRLTKILSQLKKSLSDEEPHKTRY